MLAIFMDLTLVYELDLIVMTWLEILGYHVPSRGVFEMFPNSQFA